MSKELSLRKTLIRAGSVALALTSIACLGQGNWAANEYPKDMNFSKALQCFQQELKSHPKDWTLLQNIGNCQMQLGHYDAAIDYLKKSIEVGGLHAIQCNNMAAVYQRMGDTQKAANWLKLACSLDPERAGNPAIQATIANLENPANNPKGSKAAPDYLSSLESFGRWHKADLPLKVYVRKNVQIPEYYNQFVEVVRDSLDQWCAASGGAVSYKFVNAREGANIVCDYTDHRELVSSQHELGIDGNTEMLTAMDNAPSNVNCVLLVKDAPGAPAFKKRPLVMLCCLHELGHALGMHGHSTNNQDVMFPCARLVDQAVLSERDTTTIKRIYHFQFG